MSKKGKNLLKGNHTYLDTNDYSIPLGVKNEIWVLKVPYKNISDLKGFENLLENHIKVSVSDHSLANDYFEITY